MIKQEALNQFLTGKDGIEGWFYPADMLALVAIDNLQASLGISGSICEVGVFKGKSLSFLSHLVRSDLGERLIGFHIFPEDTREEAEANTLLHAAECDIELVESNTAALTSQRLTPILQTSLRLLHIGAGHDYHEVYHQAILSAPYVHRTDVIVFDDYQDREFFDIEAAFSIFVEDEYTLTRDQLHDKLTPNSINGRRYSYPLISDISICKQDGVQLHDGLSSTKLAEDQSVCVPIYADLPKEKSSKLPVQSRIKC